MTRFLKLLSEINKHRPDLHEQIHDYYRLQFLPMGFTTYHGYMACGVATSIFQKLWCPDYKIQKVELPDSEFGYHNDHVYLAKEGIIIDPTWRQFFTDGRGQGKSDYDEMLYENTNPIFIGSPDQLQSIISKLVRKNKEVFSHSIFDEPFKYWHGMKN